MRDGMKPAVAADRSLASMVAPAEGIEPAEGLFTESPIEALDWLRELGDIARASLEPPAPDASLSESLGPTQPQAPTLEAPATRDPGAAPAAAVAAAKSEDSRLIEALLEYHRLRNPAVRSKPAAGPAFSPLDIPIVSGDVEAMRSILRPKARK